MNLVQIIFCIITTTLIIYSSLINSFERKLPTFFAQIFRYGKFAAARKSKLAIEVPKSWFKHFYILAFFQYTCLLLLVSGVYIAGMKVPDQILSILDYICGNDRISHVPKNKVFIAVCLLTLQVYRRFYDTQKVSVFGAQSKINLSHYLIGHLHYLGAALAILCEAPLFARASDTLQNEPLNLLSASLSDKVAILIFLVAWKHQYNCTKILARLRKNEKGDVVTNAYNLPEGDWFEYLSAPHQTAEIIMYGSLMWILWNNVTWFFVFVWVLANQTETILLSHWWYQEKFEDFPKKRKALIPFIY